MKNHIKIYDFKEIWFDGRGRVREFNFVKKVKIFSFENILFVNFRDHFYTGKTLIYSFSNIHTF